MKFQAKLQTFLYEWELTVEFDFFFFNYIQFIIKLLVPVLMAAVIVLAKSQPAIWHMSEKRPVSTD